MNEKLKLISWNVNGIRSAIKKGLIEYIREEDPDIICLQETKAIKGQAEFDLPEYTEYWNSATKKGYSGTAIFSKKPALNIINNLDEKIAFKDSFGDANAEGRVITAEFENFYVVTVYTPNSKRELERLDFRYQIWDPQFLKHIKELEKNKPVIFCGDLNVAHQEIDLANPDRNHMTHGFTDQEREGFSNLANAGFIDTFRMFNKEGGNYTWWSNFGSARARNVGWRIDYFGVSSALKSNVKNAFIRSERKGSDHCPIGIEVEV